MGIRVDESPETVESIQGQQTAPGITSQRYMASTSRGPASISALQPSRVR